MSLVEFLLARYSEDEAAAIIAGDFKAWRTEDHRIYLQRNDGGTVEIDARSGAEMDWWNYAGKHLPARALADIAAKRRIVEEFEDERQRKDIYNRDYPLGLLTTEGDLRARLSANARWAGLEVAVRALASVYADHPDYPPELATL